MNHLDFRDDNTDKTIINLTKSNLASYANVYEIPALCSMTKIAEKSIRVRLRMKSHKTELRWCQKIRPLDSSEKPFELLSVIIITLTWRGILYHLHSLSDLRVYLLLTLLLWSYTQFSRFFYFCSHGNCRCSPYEKLEKLQLALKKDNSYD